MAQAKLPKGVVALGLVSLFMDLSSEMIHSLLPQHGAAYSLRQAMDTVGASILCHQCKQA